MIKWNLNLYLSWKKNTFLLEMVVLDLMIVIDSYQVI